MLKKFIENIKQNKLESNITLMLLRHTTLPHKKGVDTIEKRK